MTAPVVGGKRGRASRQGIVKLTAVLVGLWLIGMATHAHAQTATERASSYLLGGQDPRGSWGAAREATAIRDTSAVLRALRALGLDGSPAYAAGLAWLSEQRLLNTDDAARSITVVSRSPLDFAVVEERAALSQARIPFGGWGLARDDRSSSPIDTALAFGALLENVDFDLDAFIYALNSLAIEQNADGGFGVASDVSLVGQSAEIVLTLTRAERVMGELFDIAPTIDRALAFLVTQQGPDGRFGEGVLDTALVVRALLASGHPYPTEVTAGIAFLLGEQLGNGSWDNDPYATAEAALAVRASGPNLSIDTAGVAFTPANPTAGNPLTLDFVVRNNGASSAAAFVVRVFRGAPSAGQQVGSDQAIAGLAPGSAAPVSISVSTVGLSGGQTFTVVIDATEVISEGDEDDNVREYWVPLTARKQTDLVVTLNDIHFSPPRGGEGDPVDLSATIRNTGDDASGPVEVRFYEGNPGTGGTLLGTQTLASVPGGGNATATVAAQTFAVGIYPIYVWVDQAGVVPEASESNNLAFRPLVVTEHVDLVLTDAQVSIEPGNSVSEGAPVTVSASVINTGSVAAVDVALRLGFNGQVVNVGTVAPDGVATAVFSVDTFGLSGFYPMIVTVDPTQQIAELDEDNNVGKAYLQVTPRADLYLGPVTSTIADPTTEGSTIAFNVDIFNQGELTLASVRVAVFDGPPALGKQITGDNVQPSIGGGQIGLPGVRRRTMIMSTSALGPGAHTLFVLVDPLDEVSESDESNNTTTVMVNIAPGPDLVAAVSVAPASAQEGDVVRVHATVTNAQPGTTFNSSTVDWRVRVYDGASAGGTLLGERRVIGFSKTGVETFDVDFHTDGRIGADPITVVADATQQIPDRDRSNNTVTGALVVVAATTAEPRIAREDISIAPAHFAVGDTVAIQTTVHNDRNVAAAAVAVNAYLGDPDAGGTLLGTTTVALPARGTASASIPWNTTGQPAGDVAIHVVVDRDDALTDEDPSNNQAARGFELGLGDGQRPTGLVATPAGAAVALTWSAPATPVAGYVPYRDGAPVALAAVASPRVSASADAWLDDRTPDRAIDGSAFGSFWEVPDSGYPHQLEVDLGAKRLVKSVSIRFISVPSRAADFDIEAWDGTAWIEQLHIVGNDLDAPLDLVLPAGLKTRKLRLVVFKPASSPSTVRVSDIAFSVLDPLTATAASDAPVLAGAHEYEVTGIDAAGIETRPSQAASAEITSVPAPAPVTAVAGASQVDLSWPADASGRRTGVYVRRDGTYLGSGTAESDISATGSYAASPAAVATHPTALLFDDSGSFFQPQIGTSAPWIVEVKLPSPRPITRVDLGYQFLNWGTDVTIETWNGTAWVTAVTVDPSPSGATTYRFAAVTTDRIRLVNRSVNAQVGVPRISDFKIFSRAPLPAATISFTDTAVAAGDHAYEVIAVDALGQTSVATAAASPAALPAVVGLTATASGRDVALAWTALAAPNLAGYRIYRDGQELNPANMSVNLAVGALATSNADAGIGDKLSDGIIGTEARLSRSPAEDHWLELELATPRRLRAAQLHWNNVAGGTSIRIETFDGSRWITQVASNADFGNQTYTFPTVVQTGRVRVLVPRQGFFVNPQSIAEFRLFGEALVSGTTSSDVALPDGTFSYQVVAVDTGGTEGARSASASATVGAAQPPSGLTASLAMPAANVSLAWNATSGVTGYHVYQNGVRLTASPLATTSTTTHLVATGNYRYEITGVTAAGFETVRSAPASISYIDVTRPSPPSGLVIVNGDIGQIDWADNAAGEDVFAYHVDLVYGPAYVSREASFTSQSRHNAITPMYGVRRATWRVTAIDASGLESVPAELVFVRPLPLPPTNVSVAASETRATVFFTPSASLNQLGTSVKRDGAPFEFSGVFLDRGTASSEIKPLGGAFNGLFNTNEDPSYWESSREEPNPFLEVSSGGFMHITRLRLRWLSPQQMGRNFVVTGEQVDGSITTLLSVSNNQAIAATYDVPDSVLRTLRVTVTQKATPSMGVGLFDLSVFEPARSSAPFYNDQPAPPGQHTYAAVAWDNGFQASLDANAAPVHVADVDLTLASSDIRFSQDTVASGDHVEISASIHNLGTATVASAVPVELYLGDPAAGGTLLATRSVAGIPGGGRADVVFPWTVTFGTQALFVIVDRTGAVAERNESNNKASKGAPYTFPFRSYSYANNSIILFGYENGTELLVRNAQTGVSKFAGTLNRGQHQFIPLAANETGVYHISGSKKFSNYVGLVDVVGHYAFDQESRAAVTDVYTLIGHFLPGFDHLLVFGTADGTSVTITNSDTQALLFQGTVNRGGHIKLSDLTSQYGHEVYLHVVASKPVTVLSMTDYGFTMAGVDGLLTSKEFFSAFQSKFGDDAYQLNLVSYQDGTFVRVVNQNTGVEMLATTLDNGKVVTLANNRFTYNELTFLHIEASNPISAFAHPYTVPAAGGGPIDESVTSAGSSGTGIGTRFLELAQPIGRGVGDFNVITSYYDNTLVTVRETARSDGTAPRGVLAIRNLDDGQFIDLGLDPNAVDAVGGIPGRLLEITANHPVTARFGGGSAAGNFMPVLFGDANNPDLVVTTADVELSTASPHAGDVLTINARSHNVGLSAAERFPIDIYDGDPARGGVRLKRHFVEQHIPGDEELASVPYQMSDGFHELHVLVDPEGSVEELNENNNRAVRLISSKPNLVPVVTGITPSPALAGETVTVTASVMNDGGTHLPRTDLQLYDGDPSAGGVAVAAQTVSLMAGETRTVSFEWNTRGSTPGPHTLYVLADGAHLIDEWNEDDNSDGGDVTLTQPTTNDLVALSVVLTPTAPFAGTPASAMVTVENRGRRTGTVPLRLRIDGVNAGADVTVPGLDTAQHVTLPVTFTAPGAGSHTLVATVDPDAALVESDESNNSASVAFTSGAPGLTLDVSASAASFGAGADAGLGVTLTNTSGARSGTLALLVRASDGTIVATVASAQPVSLAAGASATLAFVWNTGTVAPGSYRVDASYQQGGAMVAVDSTTVAVTAETPVTLGVATDRASYGPNDDVVIATHIAPRASGNAMVENAAVVTEVVAADGVTVVFTGTQTVARVAPGMETDLFTTWPVGTAAPGPYTARSTMLGASASDTFVVGAQGAQGVSVAMTVAPRIVSPGTPLGVQATAINTGNADLLGSEIEARLVDATSNLVVASAVQTADLVRGAPVDTSFAFNIDGLNAAHAFVAAVEVRHAGASLAFAFDTWSIGDTNAPVITVDGVGNAECRTPPVVPTVQVADSSTVTTTIRLDGQPFVSGTPVSADGAHVLTVHAVDATGNFADASVAFRVDGTAPVVSFTGVADGQVARELTPALVATESNAVAQTVELDGAPYTPGTLIAAEGEHTLRASVTDCAGQSGVATVHFAIDRTAPVVNVLDVVDGSLVDVDVTPIIAITDAHLVSTSITLNGAPFVSGTAVSADGDYTLRASAADAAGNLSPEAVVHFTIDKTAPLVTITGVADGQVTAAAAVTPVFSATDAHLSSLAGTLDGASFTSGSAVTSEGVHVLRVSAVDGASNSTVAIRTFTIDRTPPTITVTGVGNGLISADAVTPMVAFSDATLDTTSITLDGAAFVSGTSVAAERDHELRATARDRAGNVANVTISFSIDQTAPALTVAGVTNGQCSATPLTPTFSATDAHLVSVAGKLNGAPFASGTAVSADGAYALAVDAVDAVSHTTSVNVAFIVDATAPAITVTGVTSGQVATGPVTPVVSISEPNLTASTLRLDGSPFVSGTQVASEGAHTITVSASDCAGHTSSTSVAFTIDTTPPAIAVSGVTDGESRRTPATITVTATDLTPVTLTIQLDGATFVNGSTVSAEAAHTLIATATDAANRSTTRTVHFRIDTQAPVVTVSGVADNQSYGSAVTPVITISDADLATQSITLDGAAFSSGTPVASEGAHILSASASDRAGNSTTVVVHFRIDTQAPVVTVAGVSEGISYPSNVTPVITISDADLASQSITLDGAPFVSGTVVSAEAAHTLVASASDRVGHTTSVTVHFRVDRTAPVVTVSGVVDGTTYTSPVTPVVSVSDADLSSQLVTLDGLAFSSGNTVSAAGVHQLIARGTDRAGNSTTVTANFTISSASSGNIDADAAVTANVLIASEASCSGTPFLKSTLTTAGIRFTEVHGREAWLTALRTGRYNVVVLYRPEPSEAGTVFEELRENVAAGVGLVMIKSHPDAMPKVQPALGVTFNGKRTGATSVTLAAPLGTASVVPMIGDSVKMTLGTATGAGTSSKGDKVGAVNTYGAGHVVTLSWDTEAKTSAALASLYLASVDYANPDEPLMVAGGALSLHAQLSAQTAGDYRVDMTLPTGVTFLDSTPARDSGSLLRWSKTLALNALFKLDALLRLPETPGTYTVTVTELFRQGGVYQPIGSSTADFVVDMNPEELRLELIADLQALSLSGSNASNRNAAVQKLQALAGLTPAQAATAIGNILTAATKVASITGVNVTPIRVDLGRLLRIWEARSVQ